MAVAQVANYCLFSICLFPRSLAINNSHPSYHKCANNNRPWRWRSCNSLSCLSQVSVETVNHFYLERVAGVEHLGQLLISLLPLQWQLLSWWLRRTFPWAKSLSGTLMWPQPLGLLSPQLTSRGLEENRQGKLSPLDSRFSSWLLGFPLNLFVQVQFTGNTEPAFTSVVLNGVKLCWYTIFLTIFIFIHSTLWSDI